MADLTWQIDREGPFHINSCKPKRGPEMNMNACAERALCPQNSEASQATLEFGRFRVLLRQRQLVADGVPIKLGTRAFELLLALVGAGGSLVAKSELLGRVWPGIVVTQDNLKIQVSALRRALGADRDLIRTEFGRGYRFTGTVRSRATHRPTQWSVPQWNCRRPPHRWHIHTCSSNRFDPAHGASTGSSQLAQPAKV